MKEEGHRITRNASERLSTRILYVLIGLTALVFGTFFLIGYNRPYEENPAFKSPLLTNFLLVFVILLLIAAIATTIWAVVTSGKQNGKNVLESSRDARTTKPIPTAKISMSVIALTAILLIAGFLFSSSSPMQINGATYGEAFWLKAAGMFVATSLALLFVASCTIIYGYTRYYRKEKK